MEIEGNVIKLSKRSIVSRLFRSKDDKERIAAWRLDLNRVLHVFNVRSVTYSLKFPDHPLQTELVINIHGAVVDTRNIVSDIHRMVGRQEGNLSVSNRCATSITEKSSPLPRRKPGLRFQLPIDPISHI